MFSTTPAILYFPLYILPTINSDNDFLNKFYETVNTVAAIYLDDFIGGILMFWDIMYENYSVSSNSKILSIESDLTLKG